MDAGTHRWAVALVGLGLLATAVSLAVPWWTFDVSGFGASFETTARPFDAGQGADDTVDATAVTVTGVLVTLALLAALVDLVLEGRAYQRDERPPSVAPWLSIGAGGLILLAALTAVWTWPIGDMEFWSSAGSSFASYDTAAAAGWYLALVAGSCLAAGGWLGLKTAGPRIGTVEIRYAA